MGQFTNPPNPSREAIEKGKNIGVELTGIFDAEDMIVLEEAMKVISDSALRNLKSAIERSGR